MKYPPLLLAPFPTAYVDPQQSMVADGEGAPDQALLLMKLSQQYLWRRSLAYWSLEMLGGSAEVPSFAKKLGLRETAAVEDEGKKGQS